MRLRAAEGDVAIDLLLQQGKPPVLQGERGLSRKSAEPGNASYYYSLTRMPAAGTVRVGGERFAVTGDSWMDREWSTSSLGKDQVGWDWFALQLSDGWDAHALPPAPRGRLRRSGEQRHPDRAGRRLAAARPRRFPDRRGRRVAQPAERRQISRRLAGPRPGRGARPRRPPLLADQELDVSFRYWEGAVEIAGTHHGRPVRGRGYVELTGYAAPGNSR